MRMLQDLTTRLNDDGYQVLMMPRRKMNAEQIRAFCDKISVGSSVLAA
jgi:hypothetical protein